MRHWNLTTAHGNKTSKVKRSQIGGKLTTISLGSGRGPEIIFFST